MIQCSECRYYKPQIVDGIELIVCKRYPPLPILDEYHNMLKMRYPATDPTDECGEGRPRGIEEGD